MSVLDLVKGGNAFQNPLKGTFQSVPTALRALQAAVLADAGSFNILGVNVNLAAISPITNPAGAQLFADSFGGLADAYEGMLLHTNQQTSQQPDPNSDSPSFTQLLSANDGFGPDDQCLVAATVLGVISQKDEIIQQWLFFLANLQSTIDSLSPQSIDQIKNEILGKVEQDKEAFRNVVVEIQQNAAAKVLESAFGQKCAQRLIDAVQTDQLKVQQKLYEEQNKLIP